MPRAVGGATRAGRSGIRGRAVSGLSGKLRGAPETARDARRPPVTAAAADDLIPRHRSAPPSQPSASAHTGQDPAIALPGAAAYAAANGSGINGTAASLVSNHADAGYAFANGDGHVHAPGQPSAPTGAYRPPTAATAGELAARVRALEPAGQVEPLGPAWVAVTIVIGIMAALIALGGMVLSFHAVSVEMVPAFGVR